jgi:hypothetical protein
MDSSYVLPKYKKRIKELGDLYVLDRHICDQHAPFCQKNIISYTFLKVIYIFFDNIKGKVN